MRLTLLIATSTLALAPPAHAGSSVPNDCRFAQGDVPGESATMACYEALDRDGDGSLSPGEAAALPRLGERTLGFDQDGNGKLSPDEFQTGMSTPAQRSGGKGV
jgi:hypothetical protein